ncbi:polysaccharide biosynthesis tyrosine autokinase [Trujillonella humicola]|uniref:polysaccharide biosynthesis tyrosine autokinase n=1 Tax=Trujillonella humicola TaxID=3383699 RepID=UPI0039066A15
MDLHEFLQLLRRRWRWVVSTALAGVLAALGVSLATPASYTAGSSVFFSLGFGSSANELFQGSAFAQSQVASYAMLATTPAVLDPVVDELELDVSARALASRVSTEVVSGTVVLRVYVTDASPEVAAELTNAVTEQLIETVADLAPEAADGQATVEGTTVTPAVPPSAPSSPKTMLNVAVGLLAGLVLGVGLAVVRDLTDTRVRSAEDLARVTDLPLLAGVDVPPGKDAGRDLVVATAPRSPAAEALRSLRTAVQFTARPGEPFTLLVTSSYAAEGKSTVAANLAETLAETGLRVALVDADLRRPSVAEVFGLEGAAGLTTVLIGQAEVDDVLQDWGTSGLHVLTAGSLPPNPSELLSSPAMAEVLARLAETHDVVLVDGAPLLPVTDSAVLARLVSGTMVIADASRIRRPALTRSLGLLRQIEARVVGIVLTHVSRREVDAYGYGYEQLAESTPAEVAAEPAPAAAETPVPREPKPGSAQKRAAEPSGRR